MMICYYRMYNEGVRTEGRGETEKDEKVRREGKKRCGR